MNFGDGKQDRAGCHHRRVVDNAVKPHKDFFFGGCHVCDNPYSPMGFNLDGNCMNNGSLLQSKSM